MNKKLMNNTRDIAYAIKSKNGLYYAGFNKWEDQIRKAKLYHQPLYAQKTIDDRRFVKYEATIIKVEICELEDK